MGKAWVIVTSQQDIDSITKVKGNDFSKIQGALTPVFPPLLPMWMRYQEENPRKTDAAAQSLRLLYEQKATIIKNLIVFNDTLRKSCMPMKPTLQRSIPLFRISLTCFPAY